MTALARIIQDHTRPAVHIRRLKQPTRSHFGGQPNLPADVEWPEHDGRRLTLLARIQTFARQLSDDCCTAIAAVLRGARIVRSRPKADLTRGP